MEHEHPIVNIIRFATHTLIIVWAGVMLYESIDRATKRAECEAKYEIEECIMAAIPNHADIIVKPRD